MKRPKSLIIAEKKALLNHLCSVLGADDFDELAKFCQEITELIDEYKQLVNE